MTVYPSPRFQAERTIAAARVLLAAASLFALWMDPGELSQYSISTIVAMNWAYLLYAAGLAVITWRRSGVPGSPLAAHITDLLIFSGFQYLTPGSSSPFFIFFLFSMFCGALRWGWRGTLITAALRDGRVSLRGGGPSRRPGGIRSQSVRDADRLPGRERRVPRVPRSVRGASARRARTPGALAGRRRQWNGAGHAPDSRVRGADPERGTRRRDLGSGGGADQHAGRVVGRWIHDFDARARRSDAAPAAGSRARHVPVRDVAQ